MNAQSGAGARAGQRERSLPIIGGLRFFDRAEIKDIVAYLVCLSIPTTACVCSALWPAQRGIGEATCSRFPDRRYAGHQSFEVFQTADSYAPLSRKAGPLAAFAGMLSELAREAESLPLPDLLDRLLEQSGYLAALREDHDAGPARLENIEELKSNMLRYQEESEEPTLAGFLEEIALYTDLDSYDPQADSMVLMTIHAAKDWNSSTFLWPAGGRYFPGLSGDRRYDPAGGGAKARLCGHDPGQAAALPAQRRAARAVRPDLPQPALPFCHRDSGGAFIRDGCFPPISGAGCENAGGRDRRPLRRADQQNRGLRFTGSL